MYQPPMFAEHRPEELHRLMREHPLGALVIRTGDGLDANHLPFEFDPGQGTVGTLRAHIARANPLAQTLASGAADVLVIFRGPHGYVSPNWYPTKQETHRHVPTWNYEVVHAHGRLRLVDDEKFLRGLLARLTRRHESPEARPWKMGDAPPDFVAQMVSMVVGIEIDVLRLEGKRKLSQNRETRDFEGAVGALHDRGNEPLSSAMASTRR
jgi:transcriptional regulator